MVDALAQRLQHLQVEFLVAVGDGPAAITSFNQHYTVLLEEVSLASQTGTLSERARELARTVSTTIISLASNVSAYDARFDELAAPSSSRTDTETSHQAPSPAASLPLYQYFLSNVCYPYPDSREKERVVEEARRLGWHDYDKRKFEEWLNRKRNQSGFVAILRRYCDEDRDAMRCLCRAALFGSAEDKARLPQDAVEDIEDMRHFLQSQHDELAEQESVWVDDLSNSIEAVINNLPTRSITADNLAFSDEETCNDFDSDVESDYSDTDLDDDEPSHSIVGAKRKLSDYADVSPPSASRSLSRSFSFASSASSSSTACSLRSFSGSSMSSVTTVEWDDGEEMCDRPAKRTRSEDCTSEPSMAPSLALSGVTPQPAKCDSLFTEYRTKRARMDNDFVTRVRATKRSRYHGLGITAQTNNISETHLSAVLNVCSAGWTAAESILADFNVDLYTVDCTQPDYTADLEPPADVACEENEQKDLTWSKLQIYTIFRMLLPASIWPLPPALAQSTTMSFDVNSLAGYDVDSLNQLFTLTPADIAAMYKSITALPSAIEISTSPHAESSCASQEAPSPTSSSSSLEGLSPPALSEDSGSSTRCSSVEPSKEQDPFLVSPAALSAEYGQLYNELFGGKTLNVDPSQLKVELGVTPDVNIAADELSGAANLLARYLQDSVTAA